MNSSRNEHHIPDWKLERYLLGELDPHELQRIRQAADSDTSLRQRMEALQRSDEDIRARYPAAWMSRQIERKLAGAKTPARDVEGDALWSRLWPRPAVPVGALAVVLLAFLVLPGKITRPGGNQDAGRFVESTRIKGVAADLRLVRKTETGSEPLRDGAVAWEHDLVLIQYRAMTDTYGVILSVDGRGTVTRHLPVENEWAVPLRQNGVVPLEFAYELDDAPYWEKFYLVTSPSPFEVDDIVQAARLVGLVTPGASGDRTAWTDSLDLTAQFEQFVFTLNKEDSDEN